MTAELPPVQRPPDEDLELVQVDGLGDEIIRPALHGLDRRIDRPIGGHHDADGRRGHLECAIDEGHAIVRAEAQIGEQEVDRLCFQKAQRSGNIRGDIDVEIVFERLAQAVPGILFVVDDEDGPGFQSSDRLSHQIGPVASCAERPGRGLVARTGCITGNFPGPEALRFVYQGKYNQTDHNELLTARWPGVIGEHCANSLTPC
jgi:hypothetical protein